MANFSNSTGSRNFPLNPAYLVSNEFVVVFQHSINYNSSSGSLNLALNPNFTTLGGTPATLNHYPNYPSTSGSAGFAGNPAFFTLQDAANIGPPITLFYLNGTTSFEWNPNPVLVPTTGQIFPNGFS